MHFLNFRKDARQPKFQGFSLVHLRVLCVFMWTRFLPRQLFPSRCSIPVTQLHTGPVILLVQICSQPPLFSSHQSDSEETSQKSHEKHWKDLKFHLTAENSEWCHLVAILFLHIFYEKEQKSVDDLFIAGQRSNSPLFLIGPTLSMCCLCSLSSEYILLLCGQFWMHSTHKLMQHTVFHIISSSFKMKMFLTTLQTFVSESHRDTSQWRWTSS